MHSQRNQLPPERRPLAGTTATTKPAPQRRVARGPLMRACRLCWDLTPVDVLTFGCCSECALVLGQPTRDAAGRFTNPRLVAVTPGGAR